MKGDGDGWYLWCCTRRKALVSFLVGGILYDIIPMGCISCILISKRYILVSFVTLTRIAMPCVSQCRAHRNAMRIAAVV